jgi:anti-sigma B factor antagonist
MHRKLASVPRRQATVGTGTQVPVFLWIIVHSGPHWLAEQSFDSILYIHSGPLGWSVCLMVEFVTPESSDFGGVNAVEREEPVTEVLDCFEIEWHGNVVVVIPAKSVESLNWDLVEQAADVIMEPLATQEVPLVVVDLKDVGYFGSVFLALLLRCHKFLKRRGGELVLCGTNEMARELLKITALDTIWAIYDNRQDAMQAIDG